MKEHLDAESLYEKHADRLYRFCYRLCGNARDAEDLAADTFLVALQKGAADHSVLYGIALNKWRMLARFNAVRRRLNAMLPRKGATNTDDRVALDQAIDGLPLAIREAFILVKVEGFTHAEAAEILRRPMGTVQARVFKACELLRTELKEDPPESVPTLKPAEENGT